MMSNSTLLYIYDEYEGENELIDLESFLTLDGEYNNELDSIFNVFDYSPSNAVINRILSQIENLK